MLYSHRSTILHSYAAALPDSLNLSARDVAMPVVPLFHVNAWGAFAHVVMYLYMMGAHTPPTSQHKRPPPPPPGIPYAAALVGCKLVLPGAALDGQSLYELMEAEGVTMAAGVPTVWLGLLDHVKVK